MIKKITQILFAITAILSLTACGGGGSSAEPAETSHQQGQDQKELNLQALDLSEFNQNIIISIVDSEGNPFAGTYVQWIVASEASAEMIDAVCIDDDCTTWVIDQFPSEIIRLTATKLVEWENDSLCHDVFEGELHVDASIQELQEVQIIVEKTPSICE